MGYLTIEIDVEESLVEDVLEAIGNAKKSKSCFEFEYIQVVAEHCQESLDIPCAIAHAIADQKGVDTP